MGAARKLLKYMRPYVFFAVIGPVFMALEVAMDLLQPNLMQRIIDHGIANQDSSYIIQMGMAMLLVAVVGVIGGVGSSIFASRAAANFAADVRVQVYDKTKRLSSRNIDQLGTGKLITILTNDIQTLQQATLMTLRVFVRGPLLFIGSITVIWLTTRELFPVLLIAIPLLLVNLYFFTMQSGRLYLKVQEAMDKVNSKLQETLSGIRVIKAFDHQDYEKADFQKVNDHLMRRNMTAEQLIFILMPIMMLIINMAIVGGLWLGGAKVYLGQIQVGKIVAFINYLNIMMMGLMASSNVIMLIARAFSSAGRIVEVLETEIDIEDGVINKGTARNQKLGDDIEGARAEETNIKYINSENIEKLEKLGKTETVSTVEGHKENYEKEAYVLEFVDVTFAYGDGKDSCEPVLKNINLKIKKGETIGIIGPTASGKSSLIKLIPRLYDPQEGRIYLDGRDVRDYPLTELRSRIAMVPQKAQLFSGTIRYNLEFGKDPITDEDISRTLDRAAAREFVDRLEAGYDYVLNQGASNLSGGQKQRLAMARAFIREADIIILDDATSAIDALSEAQVRRALAQDFPDQTKIIISAKISSILDADQIILLKEGQVVGQGKHEDLLATNKLYQEIYDLQLGRGGA